MTVWSTWEQTWLKFINTI